MSSRAWQREYDAVRRACDDVAALVADKAAEERSSGNGRERGGGSGGGRAARAVATAKRKLAIVEENIADLERGIGSSGVAEGERARRIGLVNEFRSRVRYMKELLKSGSGGVSGGVSGSGNVSGGGGGSFNDRSALLFNPTTSGAAPDADKSTHNNENESTAMLNNQQLLNYQDDIMKEQDSMLDELHKTVANTKNIAIAVNDELDLHARLLDDLDSQVDQSQSNLRNAQKKIAVLFKKTRGSWKSLCLISLLIIALVVVLLMTLKVI